MPNRSASIWDIPTRLFHWSLVLLLLTSWISVELDAMEIHEWSGLSVLVLIGFRIVWGVIGSQHSRFRNFVKGPATVLRYWRGNTGTTEGHNPAGGWSVLAMLLLLLVQGVTGLFNADDVAFSGPLARTVSENTVEALGEWHELNFNLLLALVALHIGTVLFYLVRRKQNLIIPMVTGGKSEITELQRAPLWLAIVVLGASAGLLAWLLSLVPAPKVFL